MSGLDGLGWEQEITAEDAVNTLMHIADDHPCCRVAIAAIIEWVEAEHSRHNVQSVPPRARK